MTTYYTLIAQEPPKDTAPASPDNKGPQPMGNPFANPMFLVIIVMMFVFVVVMPMMNRKQKREKETMLAGLKKGAKVVTASGILGTIVAVKDGENEITLRTDDSTNSRVRVLKDSITRLVGTDEKEAAAT
ncbi:MAG TPA: preprotein translocase subunit YajC [Fimbriiglobus sp.]